MTQEFRLADIGEGLEEAEIIEWKVAVGDRVLRDQPLVEVMTDKSNAELPAPCDGVVVSVGGKVGDIVEVGGLLAIIDDALVPADSAATQRPTGSNISTFQSATAQTSDQPTATSQPSTTPAFAPPTPGPRRSKASPTTRAEAARRSIDLATVTGTGPGGRILLTDLDRASGAGAPPATDRAAHAVPSEPPAVEVSAKAEAPVVAPNANVIPLRGVRRVIAQNMARSWSDIPHIHAFAHIDAEPLLELRAQLKASGRTEFASLTPLSFFVAAVTAAMAEHPEANASLDLERGEITNHASINVGVAVAAPTGLVVPVIPDAAAQSFPEIAALVRSRVDQARSSQLSAADFRDGTVTITNFGSLGGEQALPLIRPPESAIFGFGSIAPRPFVIDDEVVARKTMNLVIGADHRLLDGDVTTAMLNHVAELLTNPINLVLGD